MRELTVLAWRSLRELVRASSTRWAALLACLALVGAVALGSASVRGAAGGLGLGLLVIAVACAVAAAASAGLLPADRRHGRAAWMATLAPAPWQQRLAPAIAGVTCSLAVGLMGGLGLCALLPSLGGGLTLERATPLALGERTMIPAASADGEGALWRATLPEARAITDERVVELEIRPSMSLDSAQRFGYVRWRTLASDGTRTEWQKIRHAVRGALRFAVASDARQLEIRNQTQGVGLRVRAARLLAPRATSALDPAVAGVGVGAMVGAVVPVAVAVSRFTTAASAAGLALTLLLFGLVKLPLLGLLASTGAGVGVEAAAGLLRTLSHAVPDLPLRTIVGDVGAGRAVLWGSAVPWLSIVMYVAVGALLVAAPGGRHAEPGT